MQDAKFVEAENKGRKPIENLIKNKCVAYEFQSTKSQVDLFVTGHTKTAAIEVKDRERYNADEVEKFGGMYIKENKFNSLMDTTISGYTPYFAVVFKDYIYLWDLTLINLEFHEEYLKVTEVEDNGWSYQSVSNLHIKDAIVKYETKRYL